MGVFHDSSSGYLTSKGPSEEFKLRLHSTVWYKLFGSVIHVPQMVLPSSKKKPLLSLASTIKPSNIAAVVEASRTVRERERKSVKLN